MSAVLNLKIICDGCGATVAQVLSERASAHGFARAHGQCERDAESKNVLTFKRVRRATLHYCDRCADRRTGAKKSLAFGV